MQWMQQQIEDADFVLMVCTETYQRRVSGREDHGVGRGVVWEGKIIYSLLYRQESPPSKFVPLLLKDGQPDHIPSPLGGHTFFFAETDDGYAALYRHLTGLPEAERPRLARVEALERRKPLYDRFALWNVPFSRNEYFTGRDDVLRDLREMLIPQGDSACRLGASASCVVSFSSLGRSSRVLRSADAWRRPTVRWLAV